MKYAPFYTVALYVIKSELNYNILNFVAAVFRSFLTFLVFVLIALSAFNPDGIVSNIFGGIMVVIGFFVSRYVYRVIMKRGILEVASSHLATPDLDNLTPSSSSEIQTPTARELADDFLNGKSLLSKGIINIWGDWNQRNLDINNIIADMEYDSSVQILAIRFDNGNKLTIWSPQIIHVTTTYLKIIKASKVLWEWGNHLAMTYQKNESKITRHTNSKWQMDSLDVDHTKPAVMIKN